MKAIGRIDERTEIMMKGQQELFQKVNAQAVNGAVQKANLKPLFWSLGIVGGALLLYGADRLIKFLIGG